MTVGVKYCGGCNPVYDRMKLVGRLKKDFPEVVLVRAGEACDILAVVCGCLVCCADYRGLGGTFGTCVLSRESDYEILRRMVLKDRERIDASGLEGTLSEKTCNGGRSRETYQVR
jgi:4-hydroxybutyrate CoA-transferase